MTYVTEIWQQIIYSPWIVGLIYEETEDKLLFLHSVASQNIFQKQKLNARQFQFVPCLINSKFLIQHVKTNIQLLLLYKKQYLLINRE